jgi:DNA-binding MarR family transcriptional regulator
MVVCAAILRSQQLIREQVDAVLDRHDLTYVRHEVLACLAVAPEQTLALGRISRVLRSPPATVTNAVDYLEAKSLVRRDAHPTDGRTTLAVMTDEGSELEARVAADLNREIHERIGLDDTERTYLLELLRRVDAAVRG